MDLKIRILVNFLKIDEFTVTLLRLLSLDFTARGIDWILWQYRPSSSYSHVGDNAHRDY